MELLCFKEGLRKRYRGVVADMLTKSGLLLAMSNGASGIAGLIPCHLESYKKVAERRGWVSMAQGDMMVRRIV